MKVKPVKCNCLCLSRRGTKFSPHDPNLCYYPALPSANAERECLDMHGRAISHGYHYIPGPAACSLCICTDGQPRLCKAVLCSPPTDCKSFRVGSSCCEFICLDDEMKHGDSSDQTAEMNLRYIASAFSAILMNLPLQVVCVSLFLVYRIRRRRQLRAALRSEATSSLGSIGYMGGGAGYPAGEDGPPGAPGLKPRSEFVPRGEAPPPYDEAVAQARVDAMRLSSEHRSALAAQSAAMEAVRRDVPRVPPHAFNHVQQVATQCYGYDVPLLQPAHPAHSERSRVMQARPPQPYNLPDLVGLGLKAASSGASLSVASGAHLTGSLGAITNRGLLAMIQRDALVPSDAPAYYTARPTSLHRTIPRLSAAEHLMFEPNPDPGFVRASRLQYLEARRSFHRAGEPRAPHADSGGSVPRDLDLAARRPDRRDCAVGVDLEAAAARRVTVKELNQEFVNDAARRQKGTILHLMGLFNDLLPAQHRVQMPDLPVPVDQPSCMCYTTADEADADEYRSECENCKSANGSRWVLEEGWAETEETQTLQRRAPPAAAPPPATATLPQPLTKQRSNPGLSSNWDNWFNVIQDSSSSDED